MILLKLLLFVLIIGAVTSIFTFVSDVRKWHVKENKVEVIASADLKVSVPTNTEEVNDNAVNDGEYNSSTVSFPWSES